MVKHTEEMAMAVLLMDASLRIKRLRPVTLALRLPHITVNSSLLQSTSLNSSNTRHAYDYSLRFQGTHAANTTATDKCLEIARGAGERFA